MTIMENKNWKNLSVIQTIKSNMGILAGLVILCVVLSFTTSSFATVTNLFNVVRQITINLFLACGMTFVILLAGIDLSVGSVIAVSGCISAGLISWNGLPVYVGILGGILAGVVIGLINGYIVSSTNIPAFIVTLAMMNIGRGIARVYTKAQTISVLDDSYTFWGMGTIFGIPIQLYCIVAVIAVSSFILNKTKLGRHIYAVGGNKQAAEYSGINDINRSSDNEIKERWESKNGVTFTEKADMDIDSFKKAVDGVDEWFVNELKSQGYEDGQDLVDLFTK